MPWRSETTGRVIPFRATEGRLRTVWLRKGLLKWIDERNRGVETARHCRLGLVHQDGGDSWRQLGSSLHQLTELWLAISIFISIQIIFKDQPKSTSIVRHSVTLAAPRPLLDLPYRHILLIHRIRHLDAYAIILPMTSLTLYSCSSELTTPFVLRLFGLWIILIESPIWQSIHHRGDPIGRRQPFHPCQTHSTPCPLSFNSAFLDITCRPIQERILAAFITITKREQQRRRKKNHHLPGGISLGMRILRCKRIFVPKELLGWSNQASSQRTGRCFRSLRK